MISFDAGPLLCCTSVAGGGYYKYTSGVEEANPVEDVHTPLVRLKRQGDEKVSHVRAYHNRMPAIYCVLKVCDKQFTHHIMY